MNALQLAAGDEAWERFARLAAGIAHPSHVAALFDGAVDEETAGRLARHPRLVARASALLERRLALPAAAPPAGAVDRLIALSSPDRLAALARQAGAVCWAKAIAREIRSERVAALKEAIGQDAYVAALAHRSEALTDDIRSSPEAPAGPQTLGEAVERDGNACLAAWLLTQSEGVARRVRLRFPAAFDDADPDQALREAGPRILRLLAA